MTETAEVTMTSVSVPARKLRSRLKAVMPHAGMDDTLPALTCIRFEVRDGSLYLVATDRYTMAVTRLRIPSVDRTPAPGRGALLRPEAVRTLRLALEGATGMAALVIEDGKLTVDTGQGESCTWETPSWEFPDWRSVLHKMLGSKTAELGDGHGIGLAKLGRFTVETDREDRFNIDPLYIRVRPGPVLLFRRGDWFLGCLALVRLHDGEPASDLWAEWASVTAPAQEG